MRLLRHKEKGETTDFVLPHPINDNLIYTHRMAIALKVGNSDESYCLFYYFIYNVKMIFARVCMDFSAVASLEMPIVVLLTAEEGEACVCTTTMTATTNYDKEGNKEEGE